jgi:hypothetical protein
MNQSSESRQVVKDLYGFDDWPRGRPARGRTLAVLSAEAAPLPLIKRQPLSGGGYIDTYGDGAETLVSVWIQHCGSPEDAHEALIDHLMACMAPRLPDAGDRGLSAGDVAFAGHDDPPTSLVFVRDHVLARIHSTGERPYPLREMASIVDDLLVGR